MSEEIIKKNQCTTTCRVILLNIIANSSLLQTKRFEISLRNIIIEFLMEVKRRSVSQQARSPSHDREIHSSLLFLCASFASVSCLSLVPIAMAGGSGKGQIAIEVMN